MRPVFPAAIALVATALLTACSLGEPEARPSESPSATATPTESESYPARAGVPDVRLTVTVLESNAAPASTRHLVCVGSSAVAGTDFPGGNEACRLVVMSPDLLERKPVKADEECLGNGNQNVADVFGEVLDKPVRNSFRRDNSCNSKTWDSLEPLFGPGSD